MCLQQVKTFRKGSKNRKLVSEGIGYKVFNMVKSTFVRTDITQSILPRGRWVKDTAKDTYFTYPTGFHIFLNLEDAKEWAFKFDIILKVEFKDVVATGYQEIKYGNLVPAIVAKSILIRKNLPDLT